MIRTVESTLPMDRVGARSLLSVRYYIENELVKPSETIEDKGGMVGYTEGMPNNGYRIFENANYIPMGFTFDSYIREDDYRSMKKGVQSDRLLVKDLILTEEQVSKYGHMLQEDLHAEEEVITEEQFADLCLDRADTACSEFEFTLSGFRAQTTLEKNNLVFFSVPYDKGFTAKVDGTEIEIEKVNGGLMAVPVSAGTHSIVFEYYPAGLRQCKVISAVTAILLIAAAVIRKKKMSTTETQMSLQ